MSGFSRDLLTGLAGLLHAAGVGTWKESGAYSTDQTAIVLGEIPEVPQKIIALATYPIADHPTLSDSTAAVQVLTRAGVDPREVDDLDDAIFDLLHNASQLRLSTGVRIVQCLRNSGAPLGHDENGRWMRSSNYYLKVHRASQHRA